MDKIKIDLGAWNGVFAVPNCVVDEHIKLAGAAQLKVLLYILRHSGEEMSTETIGQALSMHPADVADSANFWVNCGLLKKEEAVLAPNSLEQTEESLIDNKVPAKIQLSQVQNAVQPQRKPTRPPRPTGPYITDRIIKDKEFAFLAEEAQTIIGKPLSTGDLGILLNLHDMDGLPVDVITMLLQFCVSREKFGMKYIESVGISWAQQGVDNVSKAEEKIREYSDQCSAWGTVSEIFGIKTVGSPTKTQLEFSNRWLNEWGFKRDAIRLAYETCVDTKGEYNLRYIDGIIKKWHKSGVHTVSEIKQLQPSNKSAKASARKTSYDISQIESFDEFK
ncbi:MULTISPECIES: DnaD domain protein [unclassified Ruminococcus]|uniref:DnaD domain protein n=1 Tax=unclassified Ruminococcus TaxID=2608920 RepID=UPI00210AF3FF|nr:MULTISPECIES: DnaD domain protein [unclassified Ruminococcus]